MECASRQAKRRRRLKNEQLNPEKTSSYVQTDFPPTGTGTTTKRSMSSEGSHYVPQKKRENKINGLENESTTSLDGLLLQTSGSDNSFESLDSALASRSNATVNNNYTSSADHCTGLVVEEGTQHWDGRSQERPQRIRCIVQALQDSEPSLWNQCCHLPSNEDDDENQSEEDDSSKFSLTMLDYQRVHSASYLQRWQRLHTKHSQQPRAWDEESAQYHSVYATPHTWTAATRASTALCRLVHQVIINMNQPIETTASPHDHSLSSGYDALTTTETRPVRNGFAIVRPPGHHAHPSMAEGFCFINHVAVAARYALHHSFAAPTLNRSTISTTGQRRIMIVDWDIHHGDGTQAAFYSNPQVLTLSIHRKTLFPNNIHRKSGKQDHSRDRCSNGPRAVGEKEGTGFNINLAWSAPDMTDTEYYSAFDSIVLPVAREYQPDLILIAAGFDACEGDSLGDCRVSPNCFGALTQSLRQVCPQVVASLEGGYLPSALQSCAQEMVRALQAPTEEHGSESKQRAFWNLKEDDIHPSALEDIQATKDGHAHYWKCFTLCEKER